MKRETDADCPEFSLNALGRPAEKNLTDDESIEDRIEEHLDSSTRNKLNLDLEGSFIDASDEVENASRNRLNTITTYLTQKNNHLYLDTEKIARERSWKQSLDNLTVRPKRVENQTKQLLEKLLGNQVKLDRERTFATEYGSHTLSPLVNLTAGWSAYNPSEIFWTCSENTINNYTSLAWELDLATNSSQKMSHIFTFPRFEMDADFGDYENADVFRYGVLRSYSAKYPKVTVGEDVKSEASRLQDKALNLANILPPRRQPSPKTDEIDLDTLRFDNYAKNIRKEIYDVSREVSESRKDSTFEDKKTDLTKRFEASLSRLRYIMPDTVEEIYEAT